MWEAESGFAAGSQTPNVHMLFGLGLFTGCAREYPGLVLGILEKLYLKFLSNSPFAQMTI